MLPAWTAPRPSVRAPRLQRRCGITSTAACPLGQEGTLTPDEVYLLTAYLPFQNKVIPENAVLDNRVCRTSRCRLAMTTAGCLTGSPGHEGLRVTATSPSYSAGF